MTASQNLRTRRRLAGLVAAALCALTTSARAQPLYVAQSGSGTSRQYDAETGAANPAFAPLTGLSSPVGVALSGDDLFVADSATGAVGKYDAVTGAPINPNFLTLPGLNVPLELAVSGNDLFVSRYGYPGYGGPHGTGTLTGLVGEYDATTGAPINASLITGLDLPYGVALSGNALFVASNNPATGDGIVAEYNATTGAPINQNLVTGLLGPRGLVVAGNRLLVTDENVGGVGKYDATTGAAINARFITGAGDAIGLALSGNSLFVSGFGFPGAVGEYDATTGAPINPDLIQGLSGPIGLAVASPVPEASPWWMMAGCGAALCAVGLYRRRARATA